MPAPFTVITNTPTAITASPPGLLPNTTYHFRAVTGPLVGSGTAFGDDMTFTTGPPTTAPIFQVRELGHHQRYGRHLRRLGRQQRRVHRNRLHRVWLQDATYGSACFTFPDTMPPNASVSFQQARLTGLSPVTSYHWRLKLTNGQGNTYSPDQTLTTIGTPIVTTGSASNITYTGVRLDGSVVAAGHTLSLLYQYGTSTNYSSYVIPSPFQASGPGARQRHFVPPSGELAPATTHHCPA